MTAENWNRKTWMLAGPVILSNVSVPLLGAVDTAVVGQLPGPHYLGAVAVGALIFSVVYQGCNFLRMGTTGLTAQSLGAGDADEVRAWLARAGLLAITVGIILIVIQVPVIWASLLAVNPSDRVAPLTESYFSIRIWGAPMALLNLAMLGWFFGIQNTRAALATQIFMNGVNIVLDLWFVLGLGWGVEGVAWATLISEVSAVGLGLWLAARNLDRIGGHWQLSRIKNTGRLARMIRVNGDIFIRSMCLQAAFVMVISIGARMGDLTLAANAVLLNFQIFSAYAMDAFANAAEALTGEAVGARDRGRFRRAVKASSLWALIFSAGFTGLFYVVGPWLIDLLTSVEEVRQAARIYLPWVVALPMISVWSFQLDGIFIGATWTAQMRNGMAMSLAVFITALYLMVPDMGNHGLWLAFCTFMVTRALTLGVVYPRLERGVG
ncbi:MAG: MATE family efflux transporter [Alphaproteobacteria bacterium]|jgi:multidrug resistance protein, MATE family|nr:MATE family efflux transporter [Alphaproteobacteria bacterium]MBT7942016.1 MATE family efflux transporter [Alphaproteobacteria bacterium]